MAADRTIRCPACWTTVEAGAQACPQCGERFEQPRPARSFGRLVGILVGVALVGTGAVWAWSQADGADDDTEPAAEVEAQRDGNAPATDAAPFLTLRGPDGSIPLLALGRAVDHRQHYAVAASLLPRRGPLRTAAGEPFPLDVAHWDRDVGTLLMVGPAPDPRSEKVRPLQLGPRAGATALTAISPKGRRWPGIRLQPGPDGWRTDRQAPAGSVLLDPSGRAVAILGRRGAHPLHTLGPHLDRWAGVKLAGQLAEIHGGGPDQQLAEIAQLLAPETTDLTKVERALARLAAQPASGPRVARVRRLQRWAHHQRVRLLAAQDGKRALEQALASLHRFGDHHGIRADSVVLGLAHGDPQQAIHRYLSLQQTAVDEAKTIAGDVDQASRDRVRQLVESRRATDAVALAALAVRALPLRAELRLAYAEALWASGDRPRALAEGEAAVRQAPGLRGRFQRLQGGRGSSPRTDGAGTVVIRADPRRKQIRTRGTVGGQQLTFVIDTGATHSTVPRQLAERLGLMAKAKPVRIQTAGGTVDTHQVILPNLRIAGRIEARNVPATIVDLDGNIGGTGLLGMDFLQNFDWKFQDGALRLSVRGAGSKNRR